MNRPLLKGKCKKVIELIKDELGGKTMNEFSKLTAKSYSYLRDDSIEDRKWNMTKSCVTKIKLKFEGYKNCLEATQQEDKINHLKIN